MASASQYVESLPHKHKLSEFIELLVPQLLKELKDPSNYDKVPLKASRYLKSRIIKSTTGANLVNESTSHAGYVVPLFF